MKDGSLSLRRSTTPRARAARYIVIGDTDCSFSHLCMHALSFTLFIPLPCFLSLSSTPPRTNRALHPPFASFKPAEGTAEDVFSRLGATPTPRSHSKKVLAGISPQPPTLSPSPSHLASPISVKQAHNSGFKANIWLHCPTLTPTNTCPRRLSS